MSFACQYSNVLCVFRSDAAHTNRRVGLQRGFLFEINSNSKMETRSARGSTLIWPYELA